MGGLGFLESVFLGFYVLLLVVPVVYFLVIATRLTNAVERIANKLESPRIKAAESIRGRR
jgi:hypothetical protein